MAGARICLISPSNIASNPRLVKEADALSNAGYQVTVIAGDLMERWRSMDEAILQNANWQCVRINGGTPGLLLLGKIRRQWSRYVVKHGIYNSVSLAIWAHSYLSVPLAQAALKFPADLYIAHNLAALPAASWVAKHHHAKLGFDAEDFHTEELTLTADNSDYVTMEKLVRTQIEREFLPQCHHLTAGSPLIAEAYEKLYGIKMEAILNVFPCTHAPSTSEYEKFAQRQDIPSLYWFSQTIGGDRGIEAIVEAMAQMRTKVNLVLRGFPLADFQKTLMEQAQKLGLAERISFLAPDSPLEMARLAAEHDLGLSLELSEPFNKSICLSNKCFTYLLAGLPILFSRTRAQEALARELGEAAIIIDLKDIKTIAAKLDNYFSDAEKVKQSRALARRLGQEKYNWDIEQQKFLKLVSQVLSDKVGRVDRVALS